MINEVKKYVDLFLDVENDTQIALYQEKIDDIFYQKYDDLRKFYREDNIQV